MRKWLPRRLTFILLPLLLLVACTQVAGGRRGGPGALVLHAPKEDLNRESTSKKRSEYRDLDRAKEHENQGFNDGSDKRLEASNGEEDSLLFAVVSDLNGRYGQTTYADGVHGAVRWLVDDIRPDLVVSTGDMVAGQRAGLDYEAMWAGFHAAVTLPFAEAGIPFAVTPGNHDASAGAGYYRERITYVEQWRSHRPDVEFVDDRFYPLHYAFKLKGVLFVSLDATMVGPIDAPQRRWLREVLRKNQDARAKVVYGHIPLYPVSQGRETEILGDEALEAMLNEFDVDMMLSGHHHAYYPGRRKGLRLVSMACLGSGSRKLVGSEQVSPKSLVLVRVSADDKVTLDAYQTALPGDDRHPKIDRHTLPESLNDGARRIWRDDIEASARPPQR